MDNRSSKGWCGSAGKRRLRCVLLLSTAGLLIAGAAIPVSAGTVTSTGTSAEAQNPAQRELPEIIVTAPSLFRDVRPERELDHDAVDSYGVSTIDELIAELQSEFDDDEEPVFIVNGERVYDLDDIGAYPIEIIREMQVLPRGTAPRVGGSPTQRVFSLNLHRRMRSATLMAAPRIATEGDWESVRGETILTHVEGRRRANIALRVRDESALLESHRGIIQPAGRAPFAIPGNVIAYPGLAGEIDPLLSAAAGQIVTVAPIPGTSTPTLADFASAANDPNVTDLGLFRTLRPAIRSYDLNASYATPLLPWLTSNTTLRLGRSENRSRTGLASGLFLLDTDNVFSPFSTPVALAVGREEPLRSRYRREFGEANATLTARLGGSWRAIFNGRHSQARDDTRTDRTSSFTAVPLEAGTSPFSAGLGDLIDVSTSQARSRRWTTTALLTVTGSPLQLPAGPVNATLEGRRGWQSIHSQSSFDDQDRRLRRSELAARGVIQVPLASRRAGFLPQLGEVSASAEYAAIDFSDAGGAHRSVLGLTWEPVEALRLRGSIESAREPAPVEILGAPTIVTPFVRIFDPLRGETVDVTYITGGNRDLEPRSTETLRLSAILRLVQSLGLQASGEYTDWSVRNFISSLPSTSEAIMLAFPERFLRDENGVLIRVDSRPVNFARHDERRLRYGIGLNTPLGGSGRPSFTPLPTEESEEPSDVPPDLVAARRKPPTRLQITANHHVVFKDRILIRPGLDPVDLLGGGAIGLAGGRVRHQLDATAAVTSGGTGARIGTTWRGASTLQTRFDDTTGTLRFSPLLTINLRAFADLRRLFPNSDLARGSRASLNLINLTNQRQKVRDPLGNTPLQYQPGYRDPLGRTIEFELRKVF